MQFHADKQTRRDRLNSLLHCSIFEEFDVLIDNNSHYYMYLEKPPTHILKTTYVRGAFGKFLAWSFISETD